MSIRTLEDWIIEVCDEHGFDSPERLGMDPAEWTYEVCEEHDFEVPEDLVDAHQLDTIDARVEEDLADL